MIGESFRDDWKMIYPDVPPLGHMLRAFRLEMWTRFHALPESKRYAETQAEGQTILDRANAIAGFLFEPGQEVWLANCDIHYEDEPRRTSKALPGIASPLRFEFSSDESVYFEEQTRVEVFAAKTVWKPGRFDELLSEIAEDRERAVWFDPVSGRVFAPYDGGFDIVLEDSRLVPEVEAEFRQWMSASDSKL
ncbi:hypothetical protein KUW17_15290 [Leisingera aquaemixtae]|uniref:DUF3885 domain-containing protein n=1 Tax=Leisingera TaxID=191028 RepID=UPI001C93EBBC|nr:MULTISPECIES: hypothetical protein [Leisingera]MBY6068119.1 hypothetical protein [Leisingera aquaemixtae]MCB4456377.1 hypothetical protein [Leisingera sp. McT4-56]